MILVCKAHIYCFIRGMVLNYEPAVISEPCICVLSISWTINWSVNHCIDKLTLKGHRECRSGWEWFLHSLAAWSCRLHPLRPLLETPAMLKLMIHITFLQGSRSHLQISLNITKLSKDGKYTCTIMMYTGMPASYNSRAWKLSHSTWFV